VGAAMLLADSTEVKDSLARIKNFHDSYNILFSDEVDYLRKGRKSPRPHYAKERGTILDGIMAELEVLKALGQKNIFSKIRNLDEAVPRSRRISFVMTAASVSFGIILAIYITRSITVPLSEMKKKTTEIASGIFEDNLNLPHPPEIGELAAALNLMCRKLKEVDKMKSDFFLLMSHELRTPLTSIKEGTTLLQEGLAGEITGGQKKLLTIIAEESNRLIELVTSLLDLTKMEAGMMTYSFVKAELMPLIQKVIFELSPIAESKSLRFEKYLEDLPMIKMDRERILQVLRNLVGNALKFTPDGGLITISARPLHEGVEVSVSDTGPGIPKEHLQTIFDRFRQAGQPDSGNLKGTGLGLAIVRHIIDKHGGKIWIESNAGKGNTFFFVLPS
jgi:two-component system sensor histidine kinase GlrK